MFERGAPPRLGEREDLNVDGIAKFILSSHGSAITKRSNIALGLGHCCEVDIIVVLSITSFDDVLGS